MFELSKSITMNLETMESYIKLIVKSKRQLLRRKKSSESNHIKTVDDFRPVEQKCKNDQKWSMNNAQKVLGALVSTITYPVDMSERNMGTMDEVREKSAVRSRRLSSLSKGTSTDSGNHSFDDLPSDEDNGNDSNNNNIDAIEDSSTKCPILQKQREQKLGIDSYQHEDNEEARRQSIINAYVTPEILQPSSKFYLDTNNKRESSPSKNQFDWDKKVDDDFFRGLNDPSNDSNERNLGCKNKQNGQKMVASPMECFMETRNWLLTDSCDRQQAVELLTGHSTGTFLVRPSKTKRNSFALSVVVNNDVCHCLIDCVESTSDGEHCGYCFHPISDQHKMYKSLTDLIIDYRNQSMYRHHHRLDTILAHPIGVVTKINYLP